MKNFKILQKNGRARVGLLQTVHGVIETPNFIPVGTQATVKALTPRDLKEANVQIVLANTYHLMLRPGADLIEKMGGLHKFMNWQGPIMTDSGGFQVFSLGVALEHGVGKLLRTDEGEAKPRLNKITQDGVVFQSHLDGSKHILTPEKSIDLQIKYGADLIVAFDDLESPKYSYEQTLKSLELTEKWGLKSLEQYRRKSSAISRQKNLKAEGSRLTAPLLYGVTHGGIFEDLRIRSAKFTDKYFEGIALGGAHKDRDTLYKVVEWTVDNISEEKPRHLLGIGEVEDLFNGVERGVDLFDCVSPTRRARNGSLYVSIKSKAYDAKIKYRQNSFTINIRQAKYKEDKNPIDPKCLCFTCLSFSRSYLRHLFVSQEILYHQLASIHNVYFIINLVKEMREALLEGSFTNLKKLWLG